MKYVRRAVLPLCTLLLIVLGAAMPWLAARAQDQRLRGLQERFDLDAVSLILRQDAGVGDTLRLLAGNYTMLPWGGETVHDPGEVRALIHEPGALLAQAGIDGKYVLASYDMRPLLAVSEDGSLSAILWYSVWGEGGSRWFLLDDATGKLVGGRFRRSGGLVVEVVNNQLLGWEDFCQDYYGIDIVGIRWEGDDGNFKMTEGSTCILILQPEYSEPFEVRLAFYSLTVGFNEP